MALSPRQLALYVHAVNIWRGTEVRAADGKPTSISWVQQTTATPCYCDFGRSFQDLAAQLILAESDNQFTIDVFAFEAAIDVRLGDELKMTTGPEAGKFWKVRGHDQPKTRRANKLSVLCTRLPKPSAGVS